MCEPCCHLCGWSISIFTLWALRPQLFRATMNGVWLTGAHHQQIHQLCNVLLYTHRYHSLTLTLLKASWKRVQKLVAERRTAIQAVADALLEAEDETITGGSSCLSDNMSSFFSVCLYSTVEATVTKSRNIEVHLIKSCSSTTLFDVFLIFSIKTSPASSLQG